MPSPERGSRGKPPEQPGGQEQEPTPYYRAARFAGERPAAVAYNRTQTLHYRRRDVDLSAYRFQLNRIYHVAVLGQAPPADLDAQLAQILAPGDPATLPADILSALAARRRQATQFGGWVESHYRPGRPLDPPNR